MKKILIIMPMLMMALLTGCLLVDNEYKKQIVGKFHFVQTETSKEGDASVVYSIEADISYTRYRTTTLDGIMALTIFDANIGNKITLRYYISASGIYDIKDMYLIEKYDPATFKLQYIKSQNYVENYAASEMDEWLNTFLPQIKQDMQYSRLFIEELDMDKMVLTGDKNEKIIYTRKK